MKKQFAGGSALIFITAAAPLVLGMFAACSGGDPETSPAPSACSPDLASIQERIFVPSCAQAGCHGANEPAVGLSLTRVAELDRLLRRIRDEKGVTLVMIEHVIRLVMEVCDRVVVLNSGMKIAEGTPDQVACDPAVIEAYLGRRHDA